MTTIKDIAKLAGVSHTTVSQVLNNKGRVSEQKRNEILELCKKHNYRPNYSAKNLQGKKTKVIGVIVNFFGNSFFGEIVTGIENVALKNNYVLLFGDSRENHDRESMYVDTFIERQVDGIIMYPTFSYEFERSIRKLNAHGIPFVLVDKHSANQPANFVACDDFTGGYMATSHLIKKGHKKIGFLGGPPCSTIENRYKGFLKAHEENGMAFKQQMVSNFDITNKYNLIDGYSPTIKILSENPRPTALFVTTDEAIPGVMKAIRKLNMKVPDDLAIVAYGNLPLLCNEDISITTINYPQVEVGEKSASMLINMIENTGKNNELHSVYIKPDLIKRESCG